MLQRLVPTLAVVLFVLAPLGAAAQVPVSPALAARAASGSVRVLVQLRTADEPVGRFADAPQDRQARIAAAQARVAAIAGPSAHQRRFRHVPWIAMDVTPAQLAQLQADPAVAAIARDRLMRPAGVDATGFIGAPVFWQNGYQGDGWTVAVLDTGVDSGHPAVRDRVLHQACFSTTDAADSAVSLCPGGVPEALTSGSAEPCPAYVAGCEHGTVIAGVAAGRLGSVSAGVAPAARLVAVQIYSGFTDPVVCGELGLPAPCALSYTSDQIAALEHILDIAGSSNEAHIAAVNLSLSGGAFSSTCDTAESMPAFKAAVDNLRAIGIPTIVASGNGGAIDAIGMPACVSSVISVGATLGDADSLFGASNRASFLSLVAPGTDITSAIPGGGYATYNGTSMAAAVVSGGWALLRHFLPAAPVSELLDTLRSTGAAVPDSTGLAYPRIRLVEAALAANGGMPVPPGVPESPMVALHGNVATFSWSPPSTGNGATRYSVSAGSQPGASDFGTFDVGAGTWISASVGTGSYWVRVQAANPAGAGPATADQTFTVAPPALPGAPTMLTAAVNGTTVTLTWQPPASGGSPTSYIVEAGSAPGAADIAVFDTGSAAAGIEVVAVPAGTYYVRVRAVNGVGSSEVSGDVMVVVGAI